MFNQLGGCEPGAHDLAALVGKAKTGDRKAWDTLLERCQPEIIRFARNLCRNEHDALDAVQEALMKAFTLLNELRDDNAFLRWLQQIVTRCWKDKQRSTRWETKATLKEWPAPAGSNELSEQGEVQELGNHLRSMAPKNGKPAERIQNLIDVFEKVAGDPEFDSSTRILNETYRRCETELGWSRELARKTMEQFRKTPAFRLARLKLDRRQLLGLAPFGLAVAIGEGFPSPTEWDTESFAQRIQGVRLLRVETADIGLCQQLLERDLASWITRLNNRPTEEIRDLVLNGADLALSICENLNNIDGLALWLKSMGDALRHVSNSKSAWPWRYQQQQARFAHLRGESRQAYELMKQICSEDSAVRFLNGQPRDGESSLERARPWSFRASCAVQYANHLLALGFRDAGRDWLAATVHYLRENGDLSTALRTEAKLLAIESEATPENAVTNLVRLSELGRERERVQLNAFKMFTSEFLLCPFRCHLVTGNKEEAVQLFDEILAEIQSCNYPANVVGFYDACKRAPEPLRSKFLGQIQEDAGPGWQRRLPAAWWA